MKLLKRLESHYPCPVCGLPPIYNRNPRGLGPARHKEDCWLKTALGTLHEAVHTDRRIALRLTLRQAQMVRTALNREERRHRRKHAKGEFTPAPGRYDANLAVASVMADVLKQLENHSRRSDQARG